MRNVIQGDDIDMNDPESDKTEEEELKVSNATRTGL
jgi:hypothetical protein